MCRRGSRECGRVLWPPVGPQDQTLDEESYSSSDVHSRAPLLFVVLEAERPLARGARHSLVGVETVTVGRGATRDASRSDDGRVLEVRVPGNWVSSRHAVLHAVGGEWIVQDAGSRNGTFVNGQRVSSAIVHDGDVLQAGRVFFMVRGAPATQGPIQRDEDAAIAAAPFGLRTLLPELEESYDALARVARGSLVPILFLGPTGSGKEVLAREVHAQSARTGAFVAVNCGALSPMLVESLLFGHVKGSFSGAARDEPGLVRSADRGTLFLDEIGDLPSSSQAALLRVLQEHEVMPVGATRASKVDVRVVAATHRPLEVLSTSGSFRSDLLARLKGYTHRLLPLHERMADFGVLLADVLERVAAENAAKLTLMPDAAQALMAYAWPHNIRELYHVMASTVALGAGDVIQARHLPNEILSAAVETHHEPVASAIEGDDLLLRDRLVVLLHEHRGNLTAVARAMGKAPTQIHRWTRRLQIDVDKYRRS
jgi:DNA-binding NtrC family response regulator